MRNIDRLLLAHFMPLLLGRACPSTVHRSGTEGMRVNCFTTTLREGDEPNFVLLAMRNTNVEALKYDGERYSIAATLPLDSIDPAKLLVTHFYGLDEIRYEGIWAIAPGLWTRWPYALIHLRRLRHFVAQRLFNRRTLEVRRRLDVLREVVDATMGGEESIDALDLMSAKYGHRWAGHPGWEAHQRLLERHLDLLVQSGELEKRGHNYAPTGLALKTLEDAEDQDRKHSANLRVQLLLAVLTLVSAVMAAAQAGLVKLPTLLDLTERSARSARGHDAAPSPPAPKTSPTTAAAPAPGASEPSGGPGTSKVQQ
ncbi:MAG: hypothetical protein KIT60_05435 [Burkholderiaceae bacterium]|nr:hypothetical protein [Burkholderiaceae bacterium]